MKNHLCPLSIAVALIVAPVISYSASASSNDALAARVNRVLEQTPLIDGHNDLPWQIRECFVNVDGVDLRASTANLPKPAKPPKPVPPFPLPENTVVLMDSAFFSHPLVWAGAGSAQHVLGMPPAELARVARARPLDVSAD